MNPCHLYHANLRETNLTRARLNGANLRGVNGKGAYFGDASLKGTNFSEANLRYCSFTGADLPTSRTPNPRAMTTSSSFTTATARPGTSHCTRADST